MKAVLHLTEAPHQRRFGKAIKAGLERHGWTVETGSYDLPRPCDLAVTWGVRQRQLFGQPWRVLVGEAGYVGDRLHWTSLGFDGLNGRADFAVNGVDGTRWNEHFAEFMQPWRSPSWGDYALVLGQVPGDASVQGVDLSSWYEQVKNEIEAQLGGPVRFRPHPMHRETGRSLGEDLADALFAVTWNSNSGVDAVLAGVPTIAFDRGSMVWDVTAHEIGPLKMPSRVVWANRLAWCQWSPEEVENGDAWDHLRRGVVV